MRPSKKAAARPVYVTGQDGLLLVTYHGILTTRYKGLVTGARYPFSPDNRTRYMDARDYVEITKHKPGLFTHESQDNL